VLRAFHAAKGSRYFLKMDVRKYFDSVDHRVLCDSIFKLVKDPRVEDMIWRIIESYCTRPGKGIPIGNLTSQYFANHYLASIDHRAKETWHSTSWIRYMDDIVVCANSREALEEIYGKSLEACSMDLLVDLKPKIIETFRNGIPFLGFLVKPSGIFLSRRSRQRFVRNARSLEKGLNNGKILEADAAERITSMCAYTLLARSRGFRYSVFCPVLFFISAIHKNASIIGYGVNQNLNFRFVQWIRRGRR